MKYVIKIIFLLLYAALMIFGTMLMTAATILSPISLAITHIFSDGSFSIISWIDRIIMLCGDRLTRVQEKAELWCVNAGKHFRRVIIHKHWVFKYCCMFGIQWRGIVHDLSKFHPVEFFESVRYWSESGSPINEAKKQKGYSDAWYHHRGRNRHHWEFWADNFESGTNCPVMPYKYTVEMLCDWLAAGKTYNGKNFTYRDEFEWWNTLKRDRVKMHPATKEYIGRMLGWLTVQENKLLDGTIRKFPTSDEITRKSADTYFRSVEMWKNHKREINS